MGLQDFRAQSLEPIFIFLGDECVMCSRSVSLCAAWVVGLGSHVGNHDVVVGDDGGEGDDDNNGDDGDDEEVVVVIMMKMKLMR